MINDEVMLEIKKMAEPLITSNVINEFRSSVIKKLERCIEKTETEYMKEIFRSINDIIICSHHSQFIHQYYHQSIPSNWIIMYIIPNNNTIE